LQARSNEDTQRSWFGRATSEDKAITAALAFIQAFGSRGSSSEGHQRGRSQCSDLHLELKVTTKDPKEGRIKVAVARE
jgi:hypothetical protein